MSWDENLERPVLAPAPQQDRFWLTGHELSNLENDETLPLTEEFPRGEKEKSGNSVRDALANLNVRCRAALKLINENPLVLLPPPSTAPNPHATGRRRLPTGAELAEQEEKRQIWAARRQERGAADAITQEEAEDCEGAREGSQFAPQTTAV